MGFCVFFFRMKFDFFKKSVLKMHSPVAENPVLNIFENQMVRVRDNGTLDKTVYQYLKNIALKYHF